MTYTFSDHSKIPEKIQNWICEQPEYPKSGPTLGSMASLGSMTRLNLDTINAMVNKRYKPN